MNLQLKILFHLLTRMTRKYKKSSTEKGKKEERH